jgi:hypothetical protein
LQTFQVTHPFHPLVGRSFELVCHRHNWGEDRVYFHDSDGRLCSVPACWTSEGPEDPFVVVADGRSAFRVKELCELADLIASLRDGVPGDEV